MKYQAERKAMAIFLRRAADYLETIDVEQLTPSDHQADLFFRLWRGIDLGIPYSWVTTEAPTTTAEDPFKEWTVIGLDKTSPQFIRELIATAKRIGIQPLWLAAIISFETGGTFNPSIRNMAGSGATGLIQFMPATARELGTTTDALAKMTAVEQLAWVERYFQPYRGRLNSLEDCYMAVLWPAGIGKASDHAIFVSPHITYRQNAGLDINKDGKITVGEATAKVRQRIIKR